VVLSRLSFKKRKEPMQTILLHGLSAINRQEFDNILKKNKQNCMFCQPASAKKILIETNNFFVTFDDSPLIEGHLLIHSKEHLGCSAEIPDESIEEFVNLKLFIQKLIKKIYGQCVFYEHGRAGHCSISTGEILCEHFHMHALPLKTDVSKIVAQKFDQIKVKDLQQIVELYEQFDQYLYFETKEFKYFYIVADKIPSHYLRTIIANSINSPNLANWETSSNVKMINAFKQKLSTYEK
jgi:diadenosine tetraphosphate (Ap4A) HIT family hydrolase